ncbi:hypothetical protein OAG71_00710 [bacterium]|nr:hypothetical protein [bacterium]
MGWKFKFTFGIRSLILSMTVVGTICALAAAFSPSLPSKNDIAPQDSMDGKYAWEMFGGCTIAEAHEVFEADPCNRMWDFQYMGDKGFAYYFPVIENHVRERHEPGTSFQPRFDVDPLRYEVIAGRIEARFNGQVSPEILLLSQRVRDLTSFVLENAANDDKYREETIRAWTRLKEMPDLNMNRSNAG